MLSVYVKYFILLKLWVMLLLKCPRVSLSCVDCMQLQTSRHATLQNTMTCVFLLRVNASSMSTKDRIFLLSVNAVQTSAKEHKRLSTSSWLFPLKVLVATNRGNGTQRFIMFYRQINHMHMAHSSRWWPNETRSWFWICTYDKKFHSR